jgi:hypothetical protein
VTIGYACKAASAPKRKVAQANCAIVLIRHTSTVVILRGSKGLVERFKEAEPFKLSTSNS